MMSLFINTQLQAQLTTKSERKSEPVEIILPPIDIQKLHQEDLLLDTYKEIPYRYGVVFEMSHDLISMGNWTIEGDQKVMQITISSVAALTLELKFDQFYLPDGASLMFKSASGKILRNIITAEDNRSDNCFSSGLIFESQVVLELRMSSKALTEPKMRLSKVIYGYRSMDDQRKVGDCYIDINCPDGANWQIDKKAVAKILLGSGQYCTGTLVNNTRYDGRKYFLTANHCWEASNDVQNWDFYFNYESATCNGSTPYIPAVGGSVLRAKNVASDFCLVEIIGTIPASTKPVFVGWDASGVASDSSVIIHHPAGIRKKISKDNGFLTSSTWSGCPSGSHWKIGNYDLSSTEGGSSGSALFNKSHRIIGQLHGGSALCGNNLSDDYGKFSFSWNYGSSSTTRLKEWLDPINSGVVTIDRWSADTSYVSNDAQIFDIITPSIGYCSSESSIVKVVVRNLGNSLLTSATIACNVNNGVNQTLTWNGSLSRNQSDTIEFSSLSFGSGIQTIKAFIQSSNLSTDAIRYNDTAQTNVSVTDGQLIRLDIKGRKYYENAISWSIKKNGITLYSGNSYTTPSPYVQLRVIKDFCLEGGCYTFSITDNNCGGTTPGYYWLTNLATGDTLGKGCNTGNTVTVDFCVSISVTPSFNQVADICQGDALSALPTVSNNGISGTWSPALNNQQTTLYTFTPNTGQGSVNNATMTIVVNPKPTTPVVTRTGNVLHSNASSGNQWYNQIGIINGAVNQDYTAVSTGSYYSVVTLLGCESDSSNNVNIVITSIDDDQLLQFNIYPNIVSSSFTVEMMNSSKIYSYEVVNSIGQIVANGSLVGNKIIDISNLASGLYLLRISDKTAVGLMKIIKG